MRKAITALVGSTLLLASSAALAQQYGGQAGGTYGTSGGTGYAPAMPYRNDDVDNVGTEMQIVFGVDRVMGVFFDRITLEPTASTITNSTTTVALFGNASSDAAGVGPSMTTIPRLALDYFVTEGVSLGASFMYIAQSGDSENAPKTGRTTTTDLSQSVLVIHPRIGYSFIIDEVFAIWPRAGITWGRAARDVTFPNPTTGALTTVEESRTALDLSLDVPVVISPMEHFAILIGPYVDLGVSGTASVPSIQAAEMDTKQTSFGLATGVVGYF